MDVVMPIGLAPFAATDISECMTLLLRLTEADEVGINCRAGTFLIVYGRDRNRHLVSPTGRVWQRDHRSPKHSFHFRSKLPWYARRYRQISTMEYFAPHELSDDPRFLNLFAKDFDLVERSVASVWSLMTTSFLTRVARGAMKVYGKRASARSSAAEIAAEEFFRFEMRDWARGVARHPVTDEPIFDLTVKILASTASDHTPSDESRNSIERVARKRIPADRQRLEKILLQLFPDGDPVEYYKLSIKEITRRCTNFYKKRPSATTLLRARRTAYPNLDPVDGRI